MRRHAGVAHHVPGRIRIKIVDVTPDLFDEVRGRLLGTRGIRTIETNPATGSVPVLYSPGDGADIVDVVAARLTDFLVFSSDSKGHIGDYSATATTLVAAVKEARMTRYTSVCSPAHQPGGQHVRRI